MNPDMPGFEVGKWAFEQGALLVLCITVAYFYRKDFHRRDEERKNDTTILLAALDRSHAFSADLLARQTDVTTETVKMLTQVNLVLTEQANLVKTILYRYEKPRNHSGGYDSHSGDS